MSLTDEINDKLKDETEGVTWLGDQIVLLDAEKEQWDAAIDKMDRPLVTEIDEVNETLGKVRAAYQDRINVGCRTDMFWRVTGVQTNMSNVTTYDFFCFRPRKNIRHHVRFCRLVRKFSCNTHRSQLHLKAAVSQMETF